MRRKVRNWAAFLLALALVLGMIPTAYAAGYSITVNAPTGNDLPYWVFEKVGVDSADVLNLTATGTNLAFGALADHSVIPALFLGAAFCFFGLFLCFRGKVLAKHPGI